MHLIITTREDPRLPLAQLSARGQLTELRAAEALRYFGAGRATGKVVITMEHADAA